MRILLIAYYYPPIHSGGTQRPVKMKKYLPRFGHSVSVLTHSYQKTYLEDPSEIRIYDVSHNNHRHGIHTLPWFCLRGWTELLNQLGRPASIFSWWKHAVIRYADRIIAQVKPDIILATYPPVETLEIGLYFSERYKLPLVADFRDGLLFEPIEVTRITKHACLEREYARIERQVARDASLILTSTPPLANYFIDRYQCRHVETIFNGFDSEDFHHIDRSLTLDSDQFHIVHTGRFGGSDAGCNIAPFITAFRKLLTNYPTLQKNVKLHLAGQLTPKEHSLIQDLITTGSIIKHGVLTKTQTLALQRRANVLLVITGVNRKSVITTKLLEYLGANRPVLALTSQTYAETIVQNTGVGWTIHPQNEEGIFRLLESIIMDTSFYKSLNPSTEKIVQFSRGRQMKRLGDLLDAMKL